MPFKKACLHLQKEDEAVTREEYARQGLATSFVRGKAYLDGYIGSHHLKMAWLEEKVNMWAGAVKTLAAVAKRYLQSVHATVMLSLQGKWQYVQ